MDELNEITQKILEFRNARNWQQFHKAKDLAICLNVEAAELLELFLWKDEKGVNQEKLKEELADVFYVSILIANHYDLDIKKIILDKLKENEIKYPIEKSKGSNKKYTDF